MERIQIRLGVGQLKAYVYIKIQFIDRAPLVMGFIQKLMRLKLDLDDRRSITMIDSLKFDTYCLKCRTKY